LALKVTDAFHGRSPIKIQSQTGLEIFRRCLMGHQVIVEAFPTIHPEIEFTHKQAHQILRNYRTLTEGLLTEFKKAMELAAQNY